MLMLNSKKAQVDEAKKANAALAAELAEKEKSLQSLAAKMKEINLSLRASQQLNQQLQGTQAIASTQPQTQQAQNFFNQQPIRV